MNAMDELTAHLDRGWDLVEKGKLDEADAAAHKVLELEAESPEAFTLLGAIEAQRGNAKKALELYDKAIELDPEYVDPLLYAAETHLWPLEQPAEAIRLCDAALDLAEEEDEYLDALLLKAEAHLCDGDEKGARAALEDLPPVDYPDAGYHLRAGRAWLDLGDLDGAQRELEKALAREPTLVDAQHALGIVFEDRGDATKMVQTFLAVREADLKVPAPTWGVSAERFAALVKASVAELPARIGELLAKVPIHTADYPALELVAEGNDPRMMGFFSGIPYPEKSKSPAPAPHLDCVFLYQRNIERVCQTVDEVEEEIWKTLLHETGHFFGLDEEELSEMGLD